MTHYIPTEEQKEKAKQWFKTLRDDICSCFEDIENEHQSGMSSDLSIGHFERKSWSRKDTADLDHDGGGGEMSLMHGRVFEKVGVNISTVYGTFSDEFAGQIPGTDKNASYWASGISLVAHLRSPLIPAVHMNTRHIITQKSWFGGGADLNPMFEVAEDTEEFHKAFKDACDQFDPEYYPKFKNGVMNISI